MGNTVMKPVRTGLLKKSIWASPLHVAGRLLRFARNENSVPLCVSHCEERGSRQANRMTKQSHPMDRQVHILCDHFFNRPERPGHPPETLEYEP
jgi:hypothetical protein